MTTTPPTNGTKSNPNTIGVNKADTKAKERAKLEVDKEKKKKKKQREKDKKNINNNNYVKFNGIITEGIVKELTISPGSSAKMTSDFRVFVKSGTAYAAAKGYGQNIGQVLLKYWNWFLTRSGRQNVHTRVRMQ